MISFNSNIDVVINGTLAQIRALRQNPDPIARACALALLPEVKQRVHVEGKDSSDNAIGTYSDGYMVVRTGNYKNAAKFKRGAKAGQYKTKKAAGDAGIKTKKKVQLYGYNKGVFIDATADNVSRPVYNRSDDTKVILSLTRQMENDFSVIANGEGTGYGLGYNNPLNFQKAMWCEETYGKPILTQLTTQELELVQETAENFLPEYLNELQNNL